MNAPELDPGTETPAVDDNLTDAERAALAETEPQPETPDEPEPPAAAAEPADPEPSAEDRLSAAADKLGAAADALAQRAEPAPAATPAAEPEPEAPPPRDFAKELADIDSLYDDGEIDLREYNRRRDEVRDAQADQRLNERLEAERRAREEADRKAAEERANADWNQATTAFFADPSNAALIDNSIKAAAFQAAIHEAGKELPGGDFNAVLVRARELVGGAPADNANSEVRTAVNQRQRNEPEAPRTLRDVPSNTPSETPGSALDNLPIDELEDTVARMSPDKVDAFLASAPGGLSDHPRRAD